MPTDFSQVRHLVLDLDGTIYLDQKLFPFSIPFLKLLAELGIGHSFITNNNTRSAEEYAFLLNSMGVPCATKQMHTSGQATVQFLRANHPGLSRLYVLGTDSLKDELRTAGFVVCADSPEENPDAVVVGFDNGLTYETLCRAAWWIRRGKLFLATHPDRVCPTREPTVLVDCGSITACLREAGERPPDAVLGKPNREMIETCLQRHDVRPNEVMMVGDRLYTDIKMAWDAGVASVLVLSGETTRDQLPGSDVQPNTVVEDLEELGRKLEADRA